jgi:hypothetical protein
MKYYCPNQGEGPEDAQDIPEEIENHLFICHDSDVAEALAEYLWDNWAWESSWPIEIILVDDTGESRWSIEMEAKPLFYAYKVKEK